MNLLRCCDNLELMRSLERDSIDLIYIDPPYFAQKSFGEFDDRWGSMQEYLDFMIVRLHEMKRLLKPTGSIYVHLDWHASHYVKVEMDKIFGYENFRNEIIWCYRGGGTPQKDFSKRHDTILRYSKSDDYFFKADAVRIPYSTESMKRLRYKARSFRQNKIYDAYKPNPLGKHPEDWFEIQPIMPSDKKRNGYPTQKPEIILERIIKASSNDGDLVADFFCGSGTTPVVAHRLNRRWIACDLSKKAIEITQGRLTKSIKQNGKAETLKLF